MIPKLFKVEKWLHHECNKSELVYTKYYMCHDIETVNAVVGPKRHWYSYDRCEEVIEVTEVEVIIL